MKFLVNIVLIIGSLSVMAQGPYSPAANQAGSTAIHKDSTIFVSWATKCIVARGLQDISKSNSDTTSVGNAGFSLGKADGNKVVSLGDGGAATLEFSGSLYDGIGPDFAVFENAFNTTFLELAFVEVSSDGINYFRFPAHSLTNTTSPVGSFGSVDATNINNLAGKYQANYGTPFDLNELSGIIGLDIQKVTHIRIVDVVGSLDSNYARRDTAGNKINDQYPTPFPSGGFDLDAVGVIHMNTVGIKEIAVREIKVYPNPAQDHINVPVEWSLADYSIRNYNGKLLHMGYVQGTKIWMNELTKGVYFIQLRKNKEVGNVKLIVQ